jgi:hypothetical protein
VQNNVLIITGDIHVSVYCINTKGAGFRIFEPCQCDITTASFASYTSGIE